MTDKSVSERIQLRDTAIYMRGQIRVLKKVLELYCQDQEFQLKLIEYCQLSKNKLCLHGECCQYKEDICREFACIILQLEQQTNDMINKAISSKDVKLIREEFITRGERIIDSLLNAMADCQKDKKIKSKVA